MSRHFGTVNAEVSGHFGNSADMSYRQFGTGAKVSWVRSVSGLKCLYTSACVHITALFWYTVLHRTVLYPTDSQMLSTAVEALGSHRMHIVLHPTEISSEHDNCGDDFIHTSVNMLTVILN